MHILDREEVSWRTLNHGCLEASVVAIFHHIESGVGGANDKDRLGGFTDQYKTSEYYTMQYESEERTFMPCSASALALV